MTPLPNAESIARVPAEIPENMDGERPTFPCVPAEIPENMDEEQPAVSSNTEDSTVKSGSDTVNGEPGSHLVGLDLYSESDRLRTFANWTVPFVNACDLASAGFYYTNRADSVKCPFCDIELGRWEIGDDPDTEHRKHSPHCSFMVQKQSATQSSGEDSCGPFGIERRTSEIESKARDTLLEQLNINTTEIPRFPEFATYEDRIRSYENWPASSKMRPDTLSLAGFVYSKAEDRTYCFHCGGILQLWDEEDEPWIEHAHWFPKCKYVLTTRGQKFIDDARLKKHEGLAHTQQEMKKALDTIKEIVSTVDVNKVDPKDDKVKESSSEGNGNDESASSQDGAESQFDRESRMMCLICLTEEKNTVLLPCFHMVACSKCVSKLTECCVCRERIIFRQRVYIP